MARDYYAEGYQQASQDFAQGRGYKPHDLDNLMKLVLASDKQNDAFLKGYRAGYDYCAQQKLREYARQSLKAWPGSASSPHPSERFTPSQETPPGFGEPPPNEPEYR